MARVDLNADLGEGYGAWRMGDDDGLLGVVTSANVACGLHAGDPLLLRRTVRMAVNSGVAVGAHPGWPDLWGFGRRAFAGAAADDVESVVLYQLGAIAAVCAAEGVPLSHVKLHGALAHQCAADLDLALAAGRTLGALLGQHPAWTVMPGSAQELACRRLGIRPIFEAYIDRAYGMDGQLLPRDQPGAVLHDPRRAADRALEIVRRQALPTVDGRWLPAQVDSLCVHGDTLGAVEMAAQVRERLERAGVQVAAPSSD